MPFLIGACDIYAAPSRLEALECLKWEAGSCGKPVIGINAMGMLDTLVHGKHCIPGKCSREIVVSEVILGNESGFEDKHRVVFKIQDSGLSCKRS